MYYAYTPQLTRISSLVGMAILQVSNLDAVKRVNLSSIFQLIVEFGLISRTQIIAETGLAAGSVTKLTRLLMDQGLVHEVAQAESSRGRKAILLSPKSDRLQILAARASRHHLYIGLCDLSGNLIQRYSEPLQAANQDAFAEQLISAFAIFLKDYKSMVTEIVGIGITLPGLIDSQNGHVYSMPHIEVDALPLDTLVQSKLGYPCFIDNFTSAMALAEKQIGASFNTQNSLFVEVHNGVGAGLVINEQLHSGVGVGEIGHVRVSEFGKRCVCGNFGCLETEVSNSALVYKYLKISTDDRDDTRDMNINDLTQKAMAGDAVAIRVLQEAAVLLGQVLAMSVNLIRPQMLILAGEITQAWDIIHPVLEQTINQQSIQQDHLKNVVMVKSELYSSPWYSGYALVRQSIFDGLLWH